MPYYTMNWGPTLGTHIRRLRGRNLKTDGATAILPHIKADTGYGEGGLEVLVGLERSHFLWLRKKAFNNFAQWRCVGEPGFHDDIEKDVGGKEKEEDRGD